MEKNEYIKMLNLYDKHWWYKARKEIIDYQITKFKGNKKENIKILDIGCGPGYFFDIYDGIGIEANTLFRNENIINKKIEDVIIKDKFDVILILDIMEHLKVDDIVKKFIDNNLKDDGIVIITVPAYKKLYSEHDIVNNHYRRYELYEIISKFKKYKIIKKGYFNSILYPAEYIYRKVTNGKNNMKMPSKLINNTLYNIFRLEKYLIGNMLYGLSIILILQKDKGGTHK